MSATASRTLERALRFWMTHAMHVGGRYAAKRRERDLQCVAFGAFRRLAEKS